MANTRDDVRHARLSRPTTPTPPSPGGGAQAAGGRGRPRLLPALPVAGVGHRPGRPRAGRGGGAAAPAVAAASDWLRGKQMLDVVGDWACAGPQARARRLGVPVREPPLPRRGRHRRGRHAAAPPRRTGGDPRSPRRSSGRANGSSACRARDGGWGAFEPTTTTTYLNHIPFADHGALLDPPTADVTARCVSFLAQIGMAPDDPVMAPRAGVAAARAGGGRQPGSAAGAPTTSTAPGRCCARCNAAGMPPRRSGGAPRGRVPARRPARRRRLGRGRRDLRRRPARPLQGAAPRARPPGRCSG